MIWQIKLPEIKDILAEKNFFKQYVSEGKFIEDESSNRVILQQLRHEILTIV